MEKLGKITASEFKKRCLKYNERRSYVKMICNSLGYGENHMYNQMFGELYDKYLIDNCLNDVVLEIVISPMVENALQNDKEGKLSKYFLEAYIKPIALNVASGDNLIAAKFFSYMNDYARQVVHYTVEEDANMTPVLKK